jgi:hypothetical protein
VADEAVLNIVRKKEEEKKKQSSQYIGVVYFLNRQSGSNLQDEFSNN